MRIVFTLPSRRMSGIDRGIERDYFGSQFLSTIIVNWKIYSDAVFIAEIRLGQCSPFIERSMG